MRYKLSPLENPTDFEHLVKDCFERVYNISAFLYGRNGQKQDGIDILSNSGKIGIQVKNYPISKNEIKLICDNMTHENIEKFIIVTSGRRDRILQDKLLSIKKNYSFEIDLYFWDDIEEIVSQNNDILLKYYPVIYNSPVFFKNCFLDLVGKFGIDLFLKKYELTIMPIHIRYLNSIRCFSLELENLLSKNLKLGEENIYKMCEKFRDDFEEYSEFISCRLTYMDEKNTENNFRKFDSLSFGKSYDKYRETEKQADEYKNELLNIIEQIQNI